MPNNECGECRKIILAENANHLQCSLCQRGFHFSCTSISKPTCKEITKNNTQVMYFCSVCKSSATSLVANLAQLTSKYKDLESRFEALEEKIKISDQQKDEVFSHSSNNYIDNDHEATPPVNSNAFVTVEAAVKEIQYQKRRERNLMVFELEEAETDTDDNTAVKELLDAVGVNINSLVSFQRLGRVPGERPRAVKLQMGSFDVKKAALAKAKSLSVTDKFKSVYLKPGLTPIQLENRRSLLAELKAANADKRCMTIRNGRIVPIADLNTGSSASLDSAKAK